MGHLLRVSSAHFSHVNDVSNGAIFGKDTTQGMILTRTGAHIEVKEASKDALANLLLDHAIRQLG